MVGVTISAPSTAEQGKSFNVGGAVFEGPAPLGLVGLGPIAGATVTIYQNGTSKGTTTTDGAGFYSKSITINQVGTFGLSAIALGVKSNIDYITITAPPEPEPEPGWEHDSFYRGIEILVWMPDGTPFGAYFGGVWHIHALRSAIQEAIDDYLEPEPVGIPTTTTITAPNKAAVNEKFFLSGILYETETGIPIPNQPVNHSYNGKSLGGSTTGVDGDYLKEVSIPEAGTWTLKSEFPGTEALQASRALVDAVVVATPLETVLLIAGPIATGLALLIYGTS